MTYPADRLGWNEFRAYLEAHGWKSHPTKRPEIAVYRRSDPTPIEVVIPLERELADYGRAMFTAAEQVAAVEARSTDAVIHDLLEPSKDTLRFALLGEPMAMGTVGLSEGLSLLSGARKALLSSASSARKPRKFHPRLSFTEAEQYVSRCRLGQTEVGSYVVTIDAPHEIGPQLEADGPFGRRATATLLKGVASVVAGVRHGNLDALLAVENPSYSANLCDSLVEMMPKNEAGDLKIASSWSPLIGAPADVPAVTVVDRSMYEPIEQLARQLRPVTGPLDDTFIGWVSHLAGEPNTDNEVEGEVTLEVLLPDTRLHARVLLDAPSYRAAVDAHMQTKPCMVAGILHRGARGAAEIKNVRGFQMLRQHPG